MQYPYHKEHAGERTEQKVDVMVEQNKMFWGGGIEMFSGPVNKKLSRRATEVRVCRVNSHCGLDVTSKTRSKNANGSVLLGIFCLYCKSDCHCNIQHA